MQTTSIDLPLALYRFRFRSDGDFPVGADPRALWHSVFGLHLRRIACTHPGSECRECRECPQLHHCDYSYLFSGPRPPEAELMRRYDTIPVPHVLRFDSSWPDLLRAGQEVEVGMVLVGAANRHLPVVIQAMAAAGDGGLGPRRGRLRLLEVLQHLPDRDGAQPVADHGHILPAYGPEMPRVPTVPATVRVQFVSPYKPSGKAARRDGIDFGLFLMAVVRRISLLQYFYTGRRLEAPFAEIKEASGTVRVLGHSLRREAAVRYSARRKLRVDTGGLIGDVDISLAGGEALWSYLHLGQWLGVGKNASMGFGSYRLLEKGDGFEY